MCSCDTKKVSNETFDHNTSKTLDVSNGYDLKDSEFNNCKIYLLHPDGSAVGSHDQSGDIYLANLYVIKCGNHIMNTVYQNRSNKVTRTITILNGDSLVIGNDNSK